MLGRQEYKTAELPVTEASACEVQMAFEKPKKDTNHQELIKFHQNSLKQEVGQLAPISINL
jgi:hypothetical protein